jgi:site-specific DNA-adenine methylase
MGNKERLIKKGLIDLFPKQINRFIDLFCGSGIVSMNVNANSYILNDCNETIINLLKYFKENNAEETIRLSAEFEKYVRFSEGISDFIKRNEAVIKENYDLNKNEIIVLIQNLLTSIQNYKEELQPNA